MPSTMATEPANGTLTPPSSESLMSAPTSSSVKRKRSDTDHKAHVNGVKLPNGVHTAQQHDPARLQGTLNLLYRILAAEDSEARVLDATLPQTSKPSNGDPASKKARLSTSKPAATIAHKIELHVYKTFEEFFDDVEAAVSQITDPLLAREPAIAPGSYARVSALSPQESRQLTAAFAVQRLARKLVANEQKLHQPPTPPADADKHVSEDEDGGSVKDEKSVADGVIDIKLEESVNGVPSAEAGRNVLTLFGNAQGPKQLFSSLQIPSSASTILGKRPASSVFEDDVQVAVPIRDELLPNMISTTKILPVKQEDSKSNKAGPTLGDVFRAPASVRDLTPPKARQSSSRGNTITWEFPDARPKSKAGYNYTTTPLTSGQWLGYRGVDSGPEPTSPEAKRKQRDRALSIGEARPQLSDEAKEAVAQAREDALFRSVYSSFAPSRDDTGAVISSETKGMVWWHKIGAQRFHEQFRVDESAIDPALMDTDSFPAAESELDDDKIKDAVDNFEPDAEPFSFGKPEKDPAEMGTEEILEEVSDLLQTLDSYQRIRNSSLATTGHSRTPSMSQQRETVASLSGSPTSPTAGEVEIYNILKSQLRLLVSSLPPFAVAKLNGEQLADLNVKKSLLVETKDYKGVMEEDLASRAARAAALNATVGQPQGMRAGAPYGSNQYNSPGYNRSASGHLSGRPNNYYPQQQAPHGRPSFPAAGAYSTPTNFSNPQSRPGYSQQQAFNAAASATRSTSYSSTPLSNFNQAQNKLNSYAPYPRNTPQAYNQGRNYSQPTPPATYQQRPGSSAGPAQQAPMYNNYSSSAQGSASPHVRTASPLKPAPQRATYVPNPATPNYGTPNRQPLSNGTSNSIGPSGFHTSMSSAEQHSLMDRQRAQLANQPPKGHGSASPAPGTPQAT